MPDNTSMARSTTVTEVEFATSDVEYEFVATSDAEDCRIELLELLPRGDGRFAKFFAVTGASSRRVQANDWSSGGSEVRRLREYDHGGLFEVTSGCDCPAVRLAEIGAIPRTIEATEGTGRIVAEIPPWCNSVSIVEAFLETDPDVTLVAKRQNDPCSPLFSSAAFRQELFTRLTDRQIEILRVAFDAGYFDWPRDATGEDVAEELGISSPTFSQHVHAAQRKLLATLFDVPC